MRHGPRTLVFTPKDGTHRIVSVSPWMTLKFEEIIITWTQKSTLLYLGALAPPYPIQSFQLVGYP